MMNFVNKIRFVDEKIFFMFLCCAPLIVIGGFRDLNVGVDLQVYGIAFFESAQDATTFNELFRNMFSSKEYAYWILNFISCHFSRDIHLMLVLQEVIKISLVIVGAMLFEKNRFFFWIIIGWLILFYATTFSLMRQGLALAVCTLGNALFLKKCYRSFLICSIFAYFFHNSAIIMILLPLMHFICQKTKRPLLYIIPAAFILYTVSLNLLHLMDSTGLFKDGIADSYMNTGVTLAKANILFASYTFITPLLLAKSQDVKNSYPINLLASTSFCALSFLFISNYIEVGFRMSYYMVLSILFMYPYVVEKYAQPRLKQILLCGYTLCLFICFIFSAKHGLSGTIPYSSEILESFLFNYEGTTN